MNLADFDYDLPESFIAQTPLEPRDASRLMVLNRADGSVTHAHFRDLGQFLRRGDLLVFNDTRVIPARLFAHKSGTGGRVEVLLLQFSRPITPLLSRIGNVPLPPYILEPLADGSRYQTVYAQTDGSAAAPTAGLHFTPELLAQLKAAGVILGHVTLHIGLDTFSPVTVERVEEHPMHGEWCQVTEETAGLINAARREGRRVIAVGTSAVRTLESAQQGARDGEWVAPLEGATDLYLLPGYRFRVVDALITNFHLPRSTLLMLVSAFAGRERILAAYAEARRAGYRFYSFGDAMLIL